MNLKETLEIMEKNNLVIKRAILKEGQEILRALGCSAIPYPIEFKKEIEDEKISL